MSKTRLDVIRELLEKDPELFSGNRDRGKQSNLIDFIVELENRIAEQDARIAELEAIIKNLETQLQNSMDVARLMLMSMSYVDSLDSKGLSDEFEDYRRFDDPPEEEGGGSMNKKSWREFWAKTVGADQSLLDRLDEVLVNAGIEQLEAEPRWISVKDRLPENDVSVLVWVRNRYDDCSISIDYVDDGEWWEHDGSRHEALYWMPLPPPPEEKA